MDHFEVRELIPLGGMELIQSDQFDVRDFTPMGWLKSARMGELKMISLDQYRTSQYDCTQQDSTQEDFTELMGSLDRFSVSLRGFFCRSSCEHFTCEEEGVQNAQNRGGIHAAQYAYARRGDSASIVAYRGALWHGDIGTVEPFTDRWSACVDIELRCERVRPYLG